MCYICMFMHSETDRTSRGLRSKPNKIRDCITDTPKKTHACHAYNYNTYNVLFVQYNIRTIYHHIMCIYIYTHHLILSYNIYIITYIHILCICIRGLFYIYIYIMWFWLRILCICIYGILNSHTAIIFPACPSEQDASMKKVLQFLTSHAPELQPGDSARGIQGGSVSSHRSHWDGMLELMGTIDVCVVVMVVDDVCMFVTVDRVDKTWDFWLEIVQVSA